MDPDFAKYDVFGALEDADGYDVLQAVGSAAEESLRAVGNLAGNDTGVAIADTAIDAVHYAAQSAADAASEILDAIGL